MITLKQAKVGMADKVDQQVVDEFRRASWLLDRLIFDDAVSPGTGGSTLTYGYIRLLTPSQADFRAINTDYVANEAIREKKSVDLGIFGGIARVDRILEKTAAVSEMEFQLQEKITAAVNIFHNTVINGDSVQNPLEFDGLDMMLTGSSTEVVPTTPIDLTVEMTPAQAIMKLKEIDKMLAKIQGNPDVIIGNTDMLLQLTALARLANYLTQTEDAFGRPVDLYKGIPLVNIGNIAKVNPTDPEDVQSLPIIPTAADGTSSLYAFRIAQNAFHGVSPTGDKVIQTYSDGLDTTGVIRKVEVEAAMAVVLKNSLAAAVLRNIKIA